MKAFILAMVCALLGACTSSSARPSCDEIAEACHDVGTSSFAAEECHVYAEATGRTENECRSRRAECINTCAHAEDAGSTGDSASDH